MASDGKSNAGRNDLFVSHARADDKIVDAIVDLIITGIGLPDERIFCTSLEGMRIPKGKNFIEFIHSKIRKPFMVLMIITPSYYESTFCLCELGATWANSLSGYPMLCPPMEYNDLKAVLANQESGVIDTPKDLDDLRDRIIADGKLTKHSATGRWNSKRDQFLAKLPKLLRELPGPTKVSKEKFDELKSAYDEAIKDLTNLESKIEKKDDTISKLLKTKGTKEAQEVILESMDEWGKFQTLIQKTVSSFNKLPSVAIQALYYEYRGDIFAPNYWSDDGLREEVQDAEERNLISGAEDEDIRPNFGKRVMRNADEALRNLKSFLNSSSENFCDAFKDKYGIEPTLTDRDFWEDHLGMV